MGALRPPHGRRPSSPPLFTLPSSPRPTFLPRKLAILLVLSACVFTFYLLTTSPSPDPVASVEELIVEALSAEEDAAAADVMGDTNGSAAAKLIDPVLLAPLAGATREPAAAKAVEPVEKAPVDLAEARRGRRKGALPVCERTALFRFADRHGLGSEVTLLLRVAALAKHYGYALFIDSSSWNYGTWSDYFSPYPAGFPLSSPPCRLPPETTRRFKLSLTVDELFAVTSVPQPPKTTSYAPNWTKRFHVLWGSRDMDGLDATLSRLFVPGEDLAELHEHDLALLADGVPAATAAVGFLSPEETVPELFEPALTALSELASTLWTPNDELVEMMQELEERLGVADKVAVEEKSAEDLLVAVHVRLGDKFLEADRIGPVAFAPDATSAPSAATNPHLSKPGLSTSVITSYLAAAVDSVQSLLSLPSAAKALSRLPARGNDALRTHTLLELSSLWTGKPTLALMSDDAAAVEAFRKHPLAKRFRIVGTAGDAPALTEQPGSSDAVELEELDERGADSSGGKQPGRMAKRAELEKVVKRKPQRGEHHLPAEDAQKWHAAPLDVVVKQKAGETVEVPAGFNEQTFNALPLSTRRAGAQLFIRDLTILSRHADAIVMTGSSNVGRLMTALLEAARAERGEEGRREVRSLDTRWFPTARFT
ncbi:hypothetical protein JCM10207_003678 [Rhodosporidiobolus poonsookiae]